MGVCSWGIFYWEFSVVGFSCRVRLSGRGDGRAFVGYFLCLFLWDLHGFYRYRSGNFLREILLWRGKRKREMEIGYWYIGKRESGRIMRKLGYFFFIQKPNKPKRGT